MQSAVCDIADRILRKQLNNNDLTKTALRGARAMAADGYRQLFEEWLPFYSSALAEGKALPDGASAISFAKAGSAFSSAEVMTLLKIMSTLDDTCVVHRVGEERAARVKEEAEALLKEIPGQAGNDEGAGNDALAGNEGLRAMCEGYAAERISPGGAADMLALTIFIHSIIS